MMGSHDFECPACGRGRFTETGERQVIGLLGPVLKYRRAGAESWISLDGSSWVNSLDRNPRSGHEKHVVAVGPERNGSWDIARLRATFTNGAWQIEPGRYEAWRVVLWLDVPYELSTREAARIPLPQQVRF